MRQVRWTAQRGASVLQPAPLRLQDHWGSSSKPLHLAPKDFQELVLAHLVTGSPAMPSPDLVLAPSPCHTPLVPAVPRYCISLDVYAVGHLCASCMLVLAAWNTIPHLLPGLVNTLLVPQDSPDDSSSRKSSMIPLLPRRVRYPFSLLQELP